MHTVQTSSTAPLRINTVAVPGTTGLIGMTFCPGKKDIGLGGFWDRNLNSDLGVIKAWDCAAVVTLMEEFELPLLQVHHLPAMVLALGMAWLHLPIRDVSTPDELFEELWEESGRRLRQTLADGGRILLHCRGGIGRTGTIAARLLVEFGVSPQEAITMVRQARPGTIETRSQEEYVLRLRR